MQELMGDVLFAENEPFIRAAMNGSPQCFQRTLVKPSGQSGHTLARYIPDIDDMGCVNGMYVLVTDVTDLKETEAQLRLARDEAIQASKVKAEFLANMSHEIRTPLTAILGFTGLLAARVDLQETARTQVKRIKGAGAALLSIVNDILDFSKLESGQVVIKPEPVDVVELAQDALAMFGPQAESKALWLEFETSPDIPAWVSVDPARLRQILFNLIGNALKFTDEGTVRVKLAYEADRHSLRVQVEDSGAGMDEVQRERLFQRFSQVDASSTRRHGGTGLGLAICKGLTEAMGGQIGVRSQPGEGSVFHFEIYAPPADAPVRIENAEQSGGNLEGARVLVADDNLSNRELVKVMLEEFHAEVTVVADGADLVLKAAELPFDVILVDLNMPGMDGWSATRIIRTECGPNQDAPILAFTADQPDHVECEKGGFDGIVAKPISPGPLITALVQAMHWQPVDARGDVCIA